MYCYVDMRLTVPFTLGKEVEKWISFPFLAFSVIELSCFTCLLLNNAELSCFCFILVAKLLSRGVIVWGR
jgi:hypothetical protein